MHYVGFVFAIKDSTKKVADTLAPYNEQDERFMKEFDVTEEITKEYNNLPEKDEKYHCDTEKYPTLALFANEWYGYDVTKNKDGKIKISYKQNPNAKWDYWTTGGRWHGIFNNEYSIIPFTDVKEWPQPSCFITLGEKWIENENNEFNEYLNKIKKLSDKTQNKIIVHAIDFHI